MPGSGNREVIEDENNSTQEVPAASTEEKKEIPFKKPVMLQEHMKTTSIKEVLEKYQPKTQQEEIVETTSTNIAESPEQSAKENTVLAEEKDIDNHQRDDIENISSENKKEETSETVFVSLEQCWEEAIKEAATEDTIIAGELLLKQIPVATDDDIIAIEVPNEVAKQEIRQILPTLTQCLLQKTGVPYSIEVKVVKIEQEKQVDKSNPDEKFKHLCQENPKLLEFKQRLNLSIS